MIVFLDIEASSLLPGGYPIEVGWVWEGGTGEAHLIRPEPHWKEWDCKAEKVHGLSRDLLKAEGRPAAEVALRAANALRGATVYSDSPGWDGGWLDALLEVTSSSALRVLNVVEAYGAACAPLFDGLPDPDDRRHGFERSLKQRVAGRIVAAADEAEGRRERTRHRALPDAMSIWRTWNEIRRLVGEEVGSKR